MKDIAGKSISTTVEDSHQEGVANLYHSTKKFSEHLSSPIVMNFANIEDQIHVTEQ